MRVIVVSFVLCALALHEVSAQFRATVECSGFALVQDSTYTGDLKRFVDQTNEGFLPSGVQQGFFLIDANFRVFSIDAINSVSLTSLNVTVTSIEGQHTPFGKGQITENLKEGFFAIAADNQDGLTPVLKSRIETENYKRTADSLHYLLNNAIDSFLVENDSINIYYHRKGIQKIAIGSNGTTAQTDTLTATGNFLDISFDLPLLDIETKLNVTRSGYNASHGYDYTITNDNNGNRRRILLAIPALSEFFNITLRQ